ncbi:MAG: hypothetical protein QOG10_6861 [Kribbellaceae bacterium]|nr:hypothetical protein [Kribbellaceae bacterium]
MTEQATTPARPTRDGAEVRFTTHDADAAGEHFAEIRDLYAEVFAEPPHSEGPAEFDLFATRWWPSQISKPGFQMVRADHPTEGLVGATYGYHLSPDTTWWQGALEPIEDTEEWPGRTAAIIEMMVRQPWRQYGLATAMHDEFLAAQSGVERVTLLVRADNQPARRAYQRWGYQLVGRIRPARTAPVYEAMRRDLRDPRHQSPPAARGGLI